MDYIKISQTPNDGSPTTTDYAVGVDAETGLTKHYLFSNLITLFFNQTTGPLITRTTETMFDFMASGLVWSGDAYASTRLASMTAGVCYINGRRITISAVTGRTFTASKDTYIDILDNGDGTGTLVYTEVTTNAASPALASNSIRIGIIVTGATTIAAVGSVNQGQQDKVLPIASSVAYSVTDSLGNLICPRDPNRRTLGYRQIIANATVTASVAQIVGLTCPFFALANRKVSAHVFFYASVAGGASTATLALWDGAVTSGAQLAVSQHTSSAAGDTDHINLDFENTPSTTTALKTYNVSSSRDAVDFTLGAAVSAPAFLKIELS